MKQSNLLCEYLQRNTALTKLEIELIASRFTPSKLKPNEYFQKAKRPVTHIGFLSQGIVCGCVSNTNDEENIKFFLQANQFMVDLRGFQLAKPTYLSMQAITHCHISTIPLHDVDLLLREIPHLNNIINHLCWQKNTEINEEQDFLNENSSDIKYQYFQKNYPDVNRQVPLKQIASFLRITPETLSRIRARRSIIS